MRGPIVLLLAAALGGCASFSEDGGFGAVSSAVRERSGATPSWIRSEADADGAAREVKRRLEVPLTSDSAVAIALINNRNLQATYAELGIAEAEAVQAGRLANPVFSYARLVRGDALEIERSLFVNFINLLTLPARQRIGERRFAQAKLRVARETLQVAVDTRRAWHSAVAAQESVRYYEQVKLAAEARAELAARMARIGNWPRLAQLHEQTLYAETTAQLARATQAAHAERERLTRFMGLWGEDTRFSLPERLPELPAQVREERDLEAMALKSRLDVQEAKAGAEALAESAGLTRGTRFVDVFALGFEYNTEAPEPAQKGWEIALRLPIFDTGDARLAGAQAEYMQAVNRVAATAVNARSEVREAYVAYRSAWDVARHFRDHILPLRKRISEENLLRYNGMLISVFELLADARAQIAAVSATIEALRDFWLAEVALEMALTGASPGAAAMAKAGAMPSGEAARGH